MEIKEVLEAKVVRLESKVSGLESKIQQQNSLIATLQKEWQSEEMDMKLHGMYNSTPNVFHASHHCHFDYAINIWRIVNAHNFFALSAETKAIVEDLSIKLNGKLMHNEVIKCWIRFNLI